MGSHRPIEVRLAHAEAMVERNKRSAERHERKAAKLLKDPRDDKFAAAQAQWARSVRLLKKWQREARRLRGMLDTRERLIRRAPHRPDIGPDPLTREGERRLQAEERRRADKRRRLSQAGLGFDPRTAQGKRPYEIADMGRSLRASVAHLSAVLRKKSDRTDARILAWSKLDAHFHAVHAGLIPGARYEPGVDTSTIPQVSELRLQALARDEALKRHLGPDFHALLEEVIYRGRSFRDLTGLAYLGERAVGVLFKRALDLAAQWFGDDASKRNEGRVRLWVNPDPAPAEMES